MAFIIDNSARSVYFYPRCHRLCHLDLGLDRTLNCEIKPGPTLACCIGLNRSIGPDETDYARGVVVIVVGA